ncbi:MAG: Lipoprotein-releasing system transmembrane protein LolE [Chlamydiae bacterium]|nr:Lipoprotein-releasing system transmembrane protein LolE [Chlamydiota bacterium]
MSIGVISLVVWLVLVFLSVTEGIERSWLHKLTALNAPMKIHPTEKYYSSYFYRVDQYSQSAGYASRTIGQKARALLSDPYDPSVDESLPAYFPRPSLTDNQEIVDPVKSAYDVLTTIQKSRQELAFQDFEVSGAMLRLQMIRPQFGSFEPEGLDSESQLTQVSYLASFADKSPTLPELLLPPTPEDLNHLFYLAARTHDKESFATLSAHTSVEEVQTRDPLWSCPLSLLPDGANFAANFYDHGGEITHAILVTDKSKANGTLRREGNHIMANHLGNVAFSDFPLFLMGPQTFEASLNQESEEICFNIKGSLQGQKLQGTVPFQGLFISKATAQNRFDKAPELAPQWPYLYHDTQGATRFVLPEGSDGQGILLAKQMSDSGVKIGDKGYISYSAPTASSVQEMRIPVYVSGFYDPGFLAIGSRAILAPAAITSSINSAQTSFSIDRMEATGIQVWFPQLGEADRVKQEILKGFDESGIADYWTVSTYKEYDFAKDLMQQFESDKYLFTLIGAIILTVACCNIISLLVLLVDDKKKEIGILEAFGARKRSIALIFGLCGGAIGLVSSLIGIALATLTLHNIDFVVRFLSFLQGHEAFNALFFGQSLPKQLSFSALTFVLIATPVLSLIAGLVPAIKACRLNPSEILRAP